MRTERPPGVHAPAEDRQARQIALALCGPPCVVVRLQGRLRADAAPGVPAYGRVRDGGDPHRGPGEVVRRHGRAAAARPGGRRGRGARLPRPERRRQDDHDPVLLGLIRPTAGRAEIFGLDAQRDPAEAHRRLAYVPGETNLWPSLTGGETLHLLGRVQGSVDPAYRDELIERFELDPSKKVRGLLQGQPPEDRADRRADDRGPTCSSSTSRRADSTR